MKVDVCGRIIDKEHNRNHNLICTLPPKHRAIQSHPHCATIALDENGMLVAVIQSINGDGDGDGEVELWRLTDENPATATATE